MGAREQVCCEPSKVLLASRARVRARREQERVQARLAKAEQHFEHAGIVGQQRPAGHEFVVLGLAAPENCVVQRPLLLRKPTTSTSTVRLGAQAAAFTSSESGAGPAGPRPARRAPGRALLLCITAGPSKSCTQAGGPGRGGGASKRQTGGRSRGFFLLPEKLYLRVPSLGGCALFKSGLPGPLRSTVSDIIRTQSSLRLLLSRPRGSESKSESARRPRRPHCWQTSPRPHCAPGPSP